MDEQAQPTPHTPAFTIRTDTFEGPLELILELIEKRKLLVNELSLAQVTDDFITHVKNGENFPMEDASNFINVASTLLLIKSRSLLPDLELSHEEEEDVEDLTRRLKLYEVARNAARDLSRIFGRRVMLPRGESEPEVIFAPSRDLSLENLELSIRTVLSSKEKEEKLPEVRIRPLVSIEEMMDTLRDRVERAMTLSFKEFTGNKGEKIEVIVSFLALLELVKMGAMEAEQFGKWGDIKITNTSSTSVPRY
ncbi:MAG: scpA [Parcubacteria group bacterium]|nr:scpA [Parcubacteria group bacterium]